MKTLADRLWKTLRGRKLTLLTLLLLLVLETTTLLLPQAPVTPRDEAAFSRWVAELRPRLGHWTKLFANLGLLNIKSSLPFRLTLGLLGMIVVAHAERLSTEEEQDPHHRRRSAVIAVGGLLILVGWGMQMLWGWQESEVIAWPNTDLSLPARQILLPQPAGRIGIWPTQYGIYVLQRGERTGIEVQAIDDAGQVIMLLPAVNQPAETNLRFTFSHQVPEAFFATQDSQLIFRLNQANGEIQLQTYRSPSGELVTEEYLDPTAQTETVTVEGLELQFTFHKLPQYEVIYNPGALVEGMGLLSLTFAVCWPPGQRAASKPGDRHASVVGGKHYA